MQVLPTIRQYESSDLALVLLLIDHVSGREGEPALSDHKSHRVSNTADVKEFVALIDEHIVGYLQAAWHRASTLEEDGHWAIEAVLGDSVVGTEVLSLLLDAVLTEIPEGKIRMWASTAELVAAAEALRLQKVRQLLRLRLERSDFLPIAVFSKGAEIGTFVIDRDGADFLSVNNAAFAGHPENGALNHGDLAERIAQPWFDAEGFVVIRDCGKMIGFCWTKVHENGTGEIYIIAVHPESTGRGIGRRLLAAGLEHLFGKRAVPSVILYTESDNYAALKMYESVGFAIDREMGQYELPRHQPNG